MNMEHYIAINTTLFRLDDDESFGRFKALLNKSKKEEAAQLVEDEGKNLGDVYIIKY